MCIMASASGLGKCSAGMGTSYAIFAWNVLRVTGLETSIVIHHGQETYPLFNP